MAHLQLGQIVIEVTDAVAERWAELEAEAVATAAARPHGRPALWYRRDDGAVGLLYLPAAAAVTTEGPAGHTGIVTDAAATFAGLRGIDGRRPDLTDEDVAEIVRDLKAERPDLDWDNTLSGRLLGLASPDRPAFPVWEYAEVADHDPQVRLEDLTAMRFPIRSTDGSLDVTSVDEELRPMPSHLADPPRGIRSESVRAVISRYVALHDAGLLEWDATERGIVRLGSVDDVRPVLETWAAARVRSWQAWTSDP